MPEVPGVGLTKTPVGIKWKLGLGDPVTYSVRRRYLDRDLDAESWRFQGLVLEIGCGRTGRRGRFRPPRDSVTRWVCIDRDFKRLPDVCGDATKLPMRPATFDTVVCLEVLEYVWEPSSALTEIFRVLRPGGTLLLSTPFLHRVDSHDDYWRFTEPALRLLLQKAGFEVIRCVAQGGALAVVANILRYVVSVQKVRTRRLLSVVLRPLFGGFRWADAPAIRRRPVLGSFATGYLVVARSATTEGS